MQMKEPNLKRRDEDDLKHLGSQLHLTSVSSHKNLGGMFRTSVCALAVAKGILQLFDEHGDSLPLVQEYNQV